MIPQASVKAIEKSQIGEARRTASSLAERINLSATQRGQAAIIVNELATNLVNYGQRGELLMHAGARDGAAIFEVLAIDSGPGMADVDRCLQDGYSTGGTPGNGLGAVRRLASEFDIYSAQPGGTVIMARVIGTGDSPAPKGRVQMGAVSQPAPLETVCGDAWRLVQKEHRTALVIADGLGHGPLAADAANAAMTVFEQDPFVEPAAFLQSAHRALSGTRGAAIAVAQMDNQARTLRYAGVGNISGALLIGNERRGLVSHNGTTGVIVHKAQTFDYPWPENGTLVMFSDGLLSRSSIDGYAGLASRHSAIIAGVLYRDFVRGRDDATVVVVRAGEGRRHV